MHGDASELLDLVNDNDVVVGCLERSQVYAQGLHNFRVINAFLMNSQGQLWVPRRTANKRLFPLHLDVSVGGHVSSGETYDQAFAREMYEEVGLLLHDVRYERLGFLTPNQHGVSAFMWVYKFFFDGVPPYNKNDFSEYYWFSPFQFMEVIKNNREKAKGDIPLLLEHFFIDKKQ